MITTVVGTVSVIISRRLMRSRYGFRTWYSHGLIVKYCWVRVHDWRLERFPLRIAGHCLLDLRSACMCVFLYVCCVCVYVIFMYNLDLLLLKELFIIPFYVRTSVSPQYIYLYLEIFSLFNYLSVNIDITERFLVPYVFVHYYNVTRT